MAELLTIARPYAEAAFAAAKADSTDLSVWSNALDELAQLVSIKDVHAVLSDPRFDAEHRQSLLLGLLPTTLPEHVQNLCKLLIQNNRWSVLPEIAEQFNQLKNRDEGSATAHITSAFELSQEQVQQLVAGLQKKFNKALNPDVNVDPALIGGVRVVVGDQVLDTSVQAKLQSLHDILVAE